MILAIFHDMTHDMKTQTVCCYYNLLSLCSYCMFFVAMCVSFFVLCKCLKGPLNSSGGVQLLAFALLLNLCPGSDTVLFRFNMDQMSQHNSVFKTNAFLNKTSVLGPSKRCSYSF